MIAAVCQHELKCIIIWYYCNYWPVVFAEGCFGFERKLPDPAERVVVTTRSHDTEAVRKCIAACEPTEVIRVGGAGHKV